MKKLFTSLIMLMTLSMATWAASYDIKVGGVQITDANKNNINPSGKTSGTITFDSNTNTLTFDNVTLNSGSETNVSVYSDFGANLVVNFKGVNTFTSTGHNFWFDTQTEMNGGFHEDATVTINNTSSGKCGIVFNYGEKENYIYNMYLNVNTVATSIAGNWSNIGTSSVYFSCVKMTVQSSGSNAFNYFKSLSFDSGDAFLRNGSFDASKHTVVDGNGAPMSMVETNASLFVGNIIVRLGGDRTLNPKGKTAGTITYKNSSKTLILNNVAYSSATRFIDNYALQNLKIEVTGTNNINTGSSYCIRSNESFSIEGSESNYSNNVINISNSFYGFYCNDYKNVGKTLLIRNITATIKGSAGAIGGSNKADVTIQKCKITASTEDSDGAVHGMQSCTLTGCETADGTRFDASKPAFVTSDGAIAKSVNIDVPSTTYPIKVLGKQLNNVNANNFMVEGLTSGTVGYDASTKTLTLNGVTMNSTEDNTYGIWTGSDSGTITIKLVGTNSITTNYTGIGVNNNVVFTGSGNMTLRSNNDYGISCMGSCTKMSIENSSYFIVDSKSFAIYGTRNEVVLKKSDAYGYRFTNTSGGAAIYNIGKLTLDNMDFYANDNDASYAAGCYFDESKYAVVQNGGAAAKKVAFHSIKEKLPIYICGKQLNKVYNNDVIEVGSPYITAGGAKAVCYDPSTKTLTLNGATINYQGTVSNNAGIKVDNASVTINVKGNNSITGNDKMFSPLWLQDTGADVTLTGDGTLSLSGSYARCNAVYLSKATLRVGGSVTLEANGNQRGIGYNGDAPSGTLIVGENATVKASSISNLQTLTLNDGQTIVEPRGAQFKDNGVYVGSTLAQNVVIQKAESYGHTMGDITINSYNASDVLGDGTVSYDHSTKTLTLKNTKFDYTGKEPLIAANGDLNINVVGENVLTSTTYTSGIGLRCQSTSGGKINIIGDGSLKVSAKWMSVYLCSRMDLTIKDNVKVEIVGKIGDNNVLISQKLTVAGNATLKAGQIFNLKELVLEDGQTIVEPAGAEFRDGGVYVGNTLAQNVVIQKVEKYPIFVCGDQVNSYNCNDILGDGKVKYDPSTKTLTLDNAAIDYQGTASNSAGIKVENAKVTIIVKGNNSITGNNNMFSALWLSGEDTDVTLAGNGKLSLSGSYSRCNAVYLSSATLRVGGNVTLEANGNERGIGYNASPRGTLIVGENAIVKASTISSLQTLTLNDNHEIVEPAGAEFKNNGVYVGNTLAQNVVIQKHVADIYAIKIAGTQVTSDNAGDILGNGVFSYDAAKNILTVNGDYMGDDQVISSYVDDLTIELAGACTFTAKGRQTIIYAQNGLTFTGGNLTLVSDAPEKNSIGIYVEHGSLNFKDAYVDVTGDGFEYAITGEAEVPLVIENSNITASAHGEGCFKDFASMTLSGCYIDSPRGTVFENEALRDAEGNVIGGSDATETVVIKSGADAIEGIDAVAGQSDIYDVAGRKLGSMSRGINIVRSADGKTRKVLRK